MASDLHSRFHEAWLGMVQPIEGLVVSVPVLVEAQCMERHGPELQQRFRAVCPLHDAATGLALQEDEAARGKREREELERKKRSANRQYVELGRFLEEVLGWTPELYDQGEALPENLSRYISEGHQTIRPTLALRKTEGRGDAGPKDGVPDIETPESEAGKGYQALAWELPTGLAFDKPETVTGDWRYPPAAKFDRLLRACRVPVGLLTNGQAMRLVYAPHGEATGSITFDLTDMGEVGGRPILDAFVMLLSAQRFFGVREEDALPALLRRSRERQANVTNQLAAQVFEALDVLLRGFEGAAARDAHADLRALIELSRGDDPSTHRSEDDHLYGGLLTVLLRLVFLLYAEDRELLPTEHESYVKSLSLSQLFEDLQHDHGTFPDTMNRRYGAWPRVLALFRTIYDGVEHGDFHIPRRRGELFDPSRFPFLESWQLPETAVAKLPTDMAQVGVPTIDDETIYRVLERLMILEGQRLSYKVLDVEQIGSVYEALMGYGVIALGSPAVCCRHKSLQSGSRGGVWIEAATVLAEKPANRGKFLTEHYDVVKGDATKIAADLKAVTDETAILDALDRISLKKVERRGIGQLALQPGEERRRTSSHYTPRSLTEPIVRRTLEPLLLAMSDTGEPASEQLLILKICDPAMGSGAFLAETCRFLADHVVAAWEREGQTDKVASGKEDVVVYARRLVAQRCLYGVDKNRFAVTLARLSLWLFTLAKDEPFTFVDHALRHGDSLAGLSMEQVRAFHWDSGDRVPAISDELDSCLTEARTLRERILELAGLSSPTMTATKERLLWDANDAQERGRILADVLVGACFEQSKPRDQANERSKRFELVSEWLADGGPPPTSLLVLRDRLRRDVPTFHWPIEFPEVFAADRSDPLTRNRTQNGMFDAFLGNPPFLGGTGFNQRLGDPYCGWLRLAFEGSNGNADLCSYFFARGHELIGDAGSIGLIATNTIGQGDTRAAGLKYLLSQGARIYDATTSMPWPGAANVVVSLVHLARGSQIPVKQTLLNGKAVVAINSRLRGKPERPDPVPLKANENLCFKGVDVYGIGFAIPVAEAEALLESEPRYREVIRPYMGGREVNSSPTQTYERMAIDFQDWELAACEQYPAALEIVRERVQPTRNAIKSKSKSAEKLRKHWWRFGRRTPTMDDALSGLDRCLVSSQVTKHLCFSFQPADRLFSQKLWVFPSSSYAFFAALQSRVHEIWAWLLSATMKTDLSYCSSDCFDNFPLPPDSALGANGGLELVGRDLYERRARFMLERDQGLTTTYNQLKNRAMNDAEVAELRALHVRLDRAVLDAYGWSDLAVPAYGDASGALRAQQEEFEDEIVDRLFALNANRAAVEQGIIDASKSGPRRPAKKAPNRLSKAKAASAK